MKDEARQDKRYRFETRAIHAGQEPEPCTGAIVPPVYFSSTYAQSAPGEHKGFEYSRTDNPTRKALEENIASLEEARYGLAFASGMSAISTCMNLLETGDHVICSDDVYGGTFRIFDTIYKGYGLTFDFVDTADPEAVAAVLRDETRMVWIETPTNPMLKVTDIAAVADLCARNDLIFCVDNTFLSPYFQRPLGLGADVVLHSTTKYLGGHSDLIGGCLVTSDDGLHERLRFCQNAVGPVPGPMDCYLALRGTKTLAVRMDRHETNAKAVTEYLVGQPKVKKVYYPGLEDHPGHEIHKRQATGFGAVVSFDVDGRDEAERFLKGLEIFRLAESLGAVESLAESPAIMTHASVPLERRKVLKISESLIRLSVGLEHMDDLIEDLEGAFSRI